ncbi:MAG: GNAT family N-acetyltransferase [Jiangellaceae bacterium]|nr:GNAT family N-acetyltransferase [Jiangellaceae bacterium]
MAAVRQPQPVLEFRLCAAGDIAALGRVLPPGLYHRRRFAEQQAGRSSYLIAWSGDEPVGHLNLRWTGSDHAAVRGRIPLMPDVNGLGVRPELQSRGIGTALIHQAEELVRQRGYSALGLAVSVDNARARALYERLGYRPWSHGEYDTGFMDEDASGRETWFADRCVYLVKELGW